MVTTFATTVFRDDGDYLIINVVRERNIINVQNQDPLVKIVFELMITKLTDGSSRSGGQLGFDPLNIDAWIYEGYGLFFNEIVQVAELVQIMMKNNNS